MAKQDTKRQTGANYRWKDWSGVEEDGCLRWPSGIFEVIEVILG